MGRTSHGLPGIYNSSAISLNDGDGSALAVDAQGRLLQSMAWSASATVTSVNDTASSTTLLAANTGRVEAVIQNDSASTLYVKYGTTASATDYTVKLGQDDVVVVDSYTGRIDGIWSADSTGAARITEVA